jgi:hypothetical protein
LPSKRRYWRKDIRKEVTRRRRKRRTQLLKDLKESIRYWEWKAEAPDRTVWRTRCGRGCGRVLRQSVEWISECGAEDSRDVNKGSGFFIVNSCNFVGWGNKSFFL